MDQSDVRVIKGYELGEEIGIGGYGSVYRARQPLLEREVAIKIIHPNFANHPEFIRRFEAEAHLVARLEHPYIVPLYDYWRDPDGAYLVMRWLRAGSVLGALEAGPLPFPRIARQMEQVAAALTVAHRRGVVHRDLKPANILLDEEGNAYLADFGIAKDLGATAGSAQTQAQVVGSPEYLSPEQIEHGPITPQTDIYSLGITLYEMVTGNVPYPDQPLLALLYKHLHEPVPSVRLRRPDAPAALDQIIQRATAKRPADRYGDVLSFVRDLQLTLAMEQGRAAEKGAAGNGSNGQARGRRGSHYETLRLDEGLADLAGVAAPPMENPYKGLRAFEEADRGEFFGRDDLIVRLVDRLAEPLPQSRFLAVVGPSGSGKSSVVKAGLLPALRRGALPNSARWFIVEMVPSTDPLSELESALLRVAARPVADLRAQLAADPSGLSRVVRQILPSDPTTEVVLVIDQFEELFTRVADEAERVHILASLWSAVNDPSSRVRIILTLRADFYDRPLLYTPFCELLRERTEVVTALSPDELREVIVRPAEQAGLRLDEGLVDAMVHDVGMQPGALPMLQYALTELFERRVGRTLTLTPYHSAGGVIGALARRAEEIYLSLDSPQREAAQQLFLRLVTLGEGTEDTRRRVHRSEVAAVAGDQRTLDSVIDQYCQYRLLTTDSDRVTREPTVEVAHEALIRSWERLREWLDASREDLRIQRRLEAAVIEWTLAGRDPNFLVGGARLELFAGWAETTHLALNDDERAFLDASLAERDAQRALEAERQKHELELQQRSNRFLRILVGVAAIGLLVTLGLSGVAFNQRQIALRNEAAAEQSALEAEQARGSAVAAANLAATAAADAKQSAAEAQSLALANGAQAAFNDGNTDLALTLASAAINGERPVSMAELTLAQAAYAPGTRRILPGEHGQAFTTAISPDGKTALAGYEDGAIVLWDLASGQAVRTLTGHTDQVRSVVFSRDGAAALSGSVDTTLILWSVATGEAVRTLRGHTAEVWDVALSPDGTTALSASEDTTLRLWDLATGQVVRTFAEHTQPVQSVAFSPDGLTALSGSSDTTLLLWDVATGASTQKFTGHTREVWDVAFSPDGATALSASSDTSIRHWDVATGALIRSLQGHSVDVWSIAFSPDGLSALSTSQDTRVGVWDLTTGRSQRFLSGHGASVRAAVFSPDGATALSASVDTTLRQWDLASGAQVRALTGHTQGVNAVAFSPDGTLALTGSSDRTVILWDIRSGAIRWQKGGHANGIFSVAFSPDGKLALSGSEDTTVLLWDVATGEVLRTMAKHQDGVSALAFSPDGTSALSGSVDKTLIKWDIATGQPLHTFSGHTGQVFGATISPDGTTALSAAEDGTVNVWDYATGALVRTFSGHTSQVRSVDISPDGKLALSGSNDKTLLLWEIATGDIVRSFVGHTNQVRSVAFNFDGKHAMSASSDMTVRVWNTATGEELRRLYGHTGIIRNAAFSPDGRTILSGANDRTARLWRFDSVDELKAWAQQHRHMPTLTCDQQTTYRIPGQCADSTAQAAAPR